MRKYVLIVSPEIANPEELNEALKKYLEAKKAAREGIVAEVYSPPRVAQWASSEGLSPG